MFKGVLIIIVEDYKKENLEMIFNVCFKKKNVLVKFCC